MILIYFADVKIFLIFLIKHLFYFIRSSEVSAILIFLICGSTCTNIIYYLTKSPHPLTFRFLVHGNEKHRSQTCAFSLYGSASVERTKIESHHRV